MRSDGKATSWWPVKNVSADAVPAYGLMRITSVGSDGTANVTKPRGGGAIGDLLVNGPTAIPADDFGQGHRTFPAEIAFDPTGGTSPPAPGEVWGLVSGSFALKPRAAGFMILADAAGGTVMATPFHGEAMIRFRLTAALAKFGSAAATPRVWSDDDDAISFDGPPITVHDLVGVVSLAGARTAQCGWATWKTDSARWEVVAVGDFCGTGTGSATAEERRVCINGVLTTYQVSAGGDITIVSRDAGCCDNVHGTTTGSACSATTVVIASAIALNGVSLVGDGCPAFVPPFEPLCLSGPYDYDCGDGVTGERWIGSGGGYSDLTLTKCGDFSCLTYTPSGGQPATICNEVPDVAVPCSFPIFTGISLGDGFTTSLTATAGSCTPVPWNCWLNGTTGPGQGLYYCSTTDDSGSATLQSGPYDSEALCNAGCPDSFYCIETLSYSDSDCTLDENSLGLSCSPSFASGCNFDSEAGQYFKHQVISGPYETSGECSAACV